MTSLKSNAPLSGQRRWAAILFADVVGSTAIAEAVGAEAFYGLTRDLMGESWSIIEKHHGHTVEFGGDSLLAVFGAPVAVENASLNACKAALEIQNFVREAASQFESRHGVQPQLRIGLSGGVVTVGDLSINAKMRLNVLGSAVNMAARIEGIAGAGQALCASSIFDQVEALVRVEPLGPKDLKGFAEPEQVYKLVGLTAAENAFKMRLRRGAKQFFGRAGELAQLVAWARHNPAAPASVEIVGHAGIGKSRLLYELGHMLDGTVTLLSGNCDNASSTYAFHPLIGLTRDYLGWSPGSSREVLTEGISQKFGPDLAGVRAFVDLIAGISSQSPDTDRKIALAIRDGLSRVLGALSADASVALVIEDIHWIDPASTGLLKEVMKRGGLRALFTRRPTALADVTASDQVASIPLTPLERRHLGGVITSVLGVDEVPDALLEFIEQASNGMPLFAEEVVQFLRRDGQVSITDGRVSFEEKEGALIEAGNLQHLILSTFDTLSEDAQRCLELAATKGRRFSLRFLKRAFGDDNRVLAVVDEVTNIGLIEADPNGGRNTLRFSHALVVDSIYQAVLLGERKRLHGVVAAAMAQDKDTRASALAYHYEHAGVFDKAVQYYWQSAAEAMAVFAVRIADQQIERAFALIDASADVISTQDYGELLVLHCHALDAFGNFRRLNEVIEQRLPRLAAAGPSPNLVICLTLQALSRCHGAQYDRARQLIDEATQISAEIDDAPSAAWVQIAMMRIYQDADFAPIETIEEIYQRVRPVALQLGDQHMFLTAIYNLQASYRSIGQMHKANALIKELEAFGRKNNNSRAIAYANWANAINCFSKRDAKSLRKATQAVMRHAPAGTADWQVASIFTVAAGLLEPDQSPDPALFTPHMEETRAYENFTLHHTAWLGRTLAYFKSGQIARGRRELQAMEVDFRHCATNELKRVLLLYQSDILLAVAGLKPSSGPRPKLGLKDLAALVSMRVLARRKAAHLLGSYLEQTPAEAGPLVAQSHFGLGLIARSRGQTTQANDHLAKAVEFYSDQGYDAAASEVRDALNG